MSLSSWEQQALESIKNGLTGSDPELAALLSVFNRLASDEEMPDREKTRAGSRRAFRRARWRAGLRRARRSLGVQGIVLLLLWLLTTAALIAVALALGAVGNGGTCTETAAMICAGPAPGHSPGSPSDSTTTSQPTHQGAAGLVGPPSW